MTIILPSSEVGKAILKAKADNIIVQGLFIKYNVVINNTSIHLSPKKGYEFDPTDIFHLAWYVKEFI